MKRHVWVYCTVYLRIFTGFGFALHTYYWIRFSFLPTVLPLTLFSHILVFCSSGLRFCSRSLTYHTPLFGTFLNLFCTTDYSVCWPPIVANSIRYAEDVACSGEHAYYVFGVA